MEGDRKQLNKSNRSEFEEQFSPVEFKQEHQKRNSMFTFTETNNLHVPSLNKNYHGRKYSNNIVRMQRPNLNDNKTMNEEDEEIIQSIRKKIDTKGAFIKI